jgi:hypothetical protein
MAGIDYLAAVCKTLFDERVLRLRSEVENLRGELDLCKFRMWWKLEGYTGVLDAMEALHRIVRRRIRLSEYKEGATPRMDIPDEEVIPKMIDYLRERGVSVERDGDDDDDEDEGPSHIFLSATENFFPGELLECAKSLDDPEIKTWLEVAKQIEIDDANSHSDQPRADYAAVSVVNNGERLRDAPRVTWNGFHVRAGTSYKDILRAEIDHFARIANDLPDLEDASE